MEFCAGDAEVFEFLIADFNAGFVGARIQGGANHESLFRSGTGDQIHDDLVSRERTPTPVFGNEAEQLHFRRSNLRSRRWDWYFKKSWLSTML